MGDASNPSPAISSGNGPAYQKIADHLRQEILTGRYPPGTLLPSTEAFAKSLSSSYSTVHAALRSLVLEGWVERLHGSGTYVAEPEKRFLRAGIYHSLDIFSNEEAGFLRCLNECLVARLRELGKSTQIIIDSRPESEQTTLFEPLALALQHRQIQCLIAPNTNSKGFPLISHLPIPVALMAGRRAHRTVDFDESSFLLGSVQQLAQQGCRTIGLITNRVALDWDVAEFHRDVAATGVTTRPEWIFQPEAFDPNLVEYGYDTFFKLWRQPSRPDGLIVFPDTVARGVIPAILSAGAGTGPMKFVFHRNKRAKILCPFPVTWAVTDEDAAARALVQSIEQQFAGQKQTGALIPYQFEKDNAARWRHDIGNPR